MARFFANLARDVRDSLRDLHRTPAFAAGALVTVAVTVGATTAIFSVVYGVLLRQLPYRDADRVFWIWSDQAGRDRAPFNVPDFIDYRDSTRALSGYAGFFAASANLSDNATAERVQGIRATGNLCDVLGADARLGRLLQPGDELPDAEPIVVLSEPFWRRRFGGDPAIVGRAIRLDGEPHTVVGVLAAGFSMPVRDVEFVLPFAPDRDPRRGARNSLNFIIAVGRLREHVSAAQATSELSTIARRLQDRFPVENARKRGVRLIGAIEGIAGSFRTSLWTLFAAVGVVLLIACANLANLMLARATSRRKDVAIRMALGSSRTRVVRQVLVEALVVGISGGALGALAARWGVAGLRSLAPAALPRAGEIRVDVAVLLFSLAVAPLAGVLFGVVPAIAAAGVDIREALQATSRGTTAAGRRVRGVLVGAEVALAAVLVIVMTMLAKSFANVQAVEPGFDPVRVLSARLTLPARRFADRDAIVTFQRALAERLAALPGVTGTGAISLLPLSGLQSRVPFTVEGRTVERERVPVAQYRLVSPGYFETARIPLTRGRTFSERDTGRTAAVAIVNEALARKWLDGLEPIGARLVVDDNDGPPRPIEIVGVVGNVPQMALDAELTWDLYLAYPQVHPDNAGAAAANMFWLVRTSGEPMNLAAGFARELRRIDPDVAAAQIRPMEDYLTDAVAPRRFSLSLMTAFAMAALALAITGIHAVVACSISQRTRELGIRVALGASRANIRRVAIGHTVRCIAIGLGAGVAMAIAATRLLSGMLFGIAPTDATTFGEAAAVIAAVSILACAVPAARTGRETPCALRLD
jgi:putative ABC transport system permease protein